VTVGSRENPPGRPPGMSVFNVFFDSPAKRPYRTYRSTLTPTRAAVTGRGGRPNVRVEGLRAGPFAGAIESTVYAGWRLVHADADTADSTTATGSASARPRPAAATSSPGSTPRRAPHRGSASFIS